MREDYEFVWDDRKDAQNLAKHGISFSEATAVWGDPFFVEVHLTSEPEDRWLVVGRTGKDTFLAAIITYRGEAVRLISARQATKREVDLYDENQ